MSPAIPTESEMATGGAAPPYGLLGVNVPLQRSRRVSEEEGREVNKGARTFVNVTETVASHVYILLKIARELTIAAPTRSSWHKTVVSH